MDQGTSGVMEHTQCLVPQIAFMARAGEVGFPGPLESNGSVQMCTSIESSLSNIVG